MKKLIKKLIEKTGYTIAHKKYIYPQDIYGDKEFMAIYEKCKPYTVVSIERSFALYKAVQYIAKSEIRGDFVECGVWRGGQAMLAAHTLLESGDITRKLWLYDTYAGMAKPTDIDVTIGESKQAIEKWEKENREGHNKWAYASLDEVKRNMYSTGYRKDKIEFVKGKVEDTIPGTSPEKISLLHLDTDFYESTYHELMHLYPVLERGGILLIDDYGSWEGARKAVDQYIQENKISIFLNRIDNTGRIGIKI